MSRMFIKNHLQFRERVQVGMTLRRLWHYQDESILERKIVEVLIKGFWVEEDGYEEPLWFDLGTAKDWVFMDGAIYMIFNHDLDNTRKSKELNKEDYSRYQERLACYIENLKTSDERKIKGYKVLAVYELCF